MSVLILGHKGGLGGDLVKYLQDLGEQVHTVRGRWPSEEFKNSILSLSNLDYIVNCIATTTTEGDFSINYEVPLWLDSIPDHVCKKIVYPGTDCLGEKTPYANSKLKAVRYITNSKKTKVINCSFITKRKGLLKWFLNDSGDTVDGYSDVFWNGLTSLEWFKVLIDLIKNWSTTSSIITPYSECISKYDLLCVMNEVFKTEKTIKRVRTQTINRCLKGDIKVKSIKRQLLENL